MTSIKRRTFLRATGAAVAAAVLTKPTISGADATAKNPWKKAFMLGGVSKGSPLASFQLLKEAGFEGVELISPNELDLSEVLSARDKTGLTIHGVSGSRHWQDTLSDPDPARRRPRDGRDSSGIFRLQSLRRHDGPGGTGGRDRNVSYRDAYNRSQKKSVS